MWSKFFYFAVQPAFSELECRAIIELGAALPVERSVLHRHTGALHRTSSIRWLHADQDNQWIFDRINSGVETYNADYGYEILPNSASPAQLTHYAVGEEYKYHTDISSGAMSLRKISCSIELSDPSDYEGGGLIVGEDKVEMRRGDMAMFPSIMLHKATKVSSGERWSLVCWILGERPLR